MSGDGVNHYGSEGTNRITKTLNDFIQCCKYFIVETHPAQFFPNLFNRIHFRGIWRQEKQFNIFWNYERSGLMPGSSVAAQENDVVRVLL